MRVRYRFPVTGQLRLRFAFDIPVDPVTYDFEGGPDGELLFIGATVSVPERSMWPILRPSPESGIALHIEMSSPFFDLVRKNLRSTESILSLFGVESIDTENAEESWLPDSEEEREELKLFGVKRSKQKIPARDWPYTEFDLVARALLAAPDAYDSETALSFFRKGSIDMMEERFLEATMDFLFMIESLFAHGKIKSAQVECEYLKSDVLQSAIKKTLSEKTHMQSINRDARIKAAYARNYDGKDANQITKRLINLRGFIHHHSSTNKEIWHPDDHIRFGADAHFLHHLCFNVGFRVVESALFSDTHAATYVALYKEAVKKQSA